jgi:hypothetical protein
MSGRELQSYMEGTRMNDQKEWERTRSLAYFIVNKDVKSSKQIPLKRVLRFPWDSYKAARWH